jgi:hypothetical protein
MMPALENREISFNPVRIHVAANIFANAMIDCLMLGKHCADTRAAVIAHHARIRVKQRIQNRAKSFGANGGDEG